MLAALGTLVLDVVSTIQGRLILRYAQDDKGGFGPSTQAP
jgi:hypothetical protein